jgi:hypothetical protein
VLAGLLAACLSGVAAVALAALFVPREWLAHSPPASAPPTTVALEPTALGGPSGACNLAFTCCDEYRRMLGHDAACEEVHDYDRQPRSLCDQVRMQYRSALELEQYDARMCDP